jgi:dihydrofolate reductase
MRKVVVSEFVSLGGVIQAPGGEDEDRAGGFVHGGWTWPYWHDDIGAHFAQVMSESDALLLGRKTWQIHGGAFEPMADDDPNAAAMNAVPKYAVSTTLTSAAAWRNSTLIRGEVVEEGTRPEGAAGKEHPHRRQ